MGHLTKFLHLSNKLAEKGHQILFIAPSSTHSKLHQFNLHPHLIKFFPIPVPDVDGLPPATQSTADVPFPMYSLLRRAMDLTQPTMDSLLQQHNPHFIFFDFTHWVPALARRHGVKSVHYCTISPASAAYLFRDEPTAEAFLGPPVGFPPSSKIKLYAHEARAVHAINKRLEFGYEMKFVERMVLTTMECDALVFSSCVEMEGSYCEFLEKRFQKPVILTGPVFPEPPAAELDLKWKNWLDQFEPKSVVFCALGSEARLQAVQFEELVLGLEMARIPFLAALKPPMGAETVEEALPQGLSGRIEKRGKIEGDWVQQQLILSHPSIGCFVSHCGWGSILEGLMTNCQLVLMPLVGDQPINARLMAADLRVGVEVDKGDPNGLVTRHAVVRAIHLTMDTGSNIGAEIKANHTKMRDFLLNKPLHNSYFDDFVHKLRALLNPS